MKISVVLCTYQGERFLAEQLESLAEQERPPNELIVCDDRSTDGTMDILSWFSRSAPFPVRVEQQSENVGSTRNFACAIGLATGDVIALADQDDVWLPRKLRAIETRFERAPETAFVFSDAEIVDESLLPLGHRLWEAVAFGEAERRTVRDGRAPELLVRYNVVTGATMAFRAEFRDTVLPIPPRWVHDGWIALVLSLIAPCAFIAEPLILYRQHAGQQLGGRRTTLREKARIACGQNTATFRHLARDYAAALVRARRLGGSVRDLRWVEALESKVRHCLVRADMRRGGPRLWLAVLELLRGNYSRCSLGWKSFVQDLVLCPPSARESEAAEAAEADEPVEAVERPTESEPPTEAVEHSEQLEHA